MSNEQEIESRITKLENAFEIINRLENKIDNIAILTTKLASIEEKHHYQSTAIERAFKAIEKNAIQIESIREAFITHDKSSINNVASIKEEIRSTLREYAVEIEREQEAIKNRMNNIEKDITAKTNWAKGAWFAASILWIIIQIGVVFSIKETISAMDDMHSQIELNKTHIIELTVEKSNNNR